MVKPITDKALTATINRITQPTCRRQRRQPPHRDGDRRARRRRLDLVAVNFAWLLAHEQKRRRRCIDLDLQHGTLALALDLEPTRGLREALEHPERIDSLFIAAPR